MYLNIEDPLLMKILRIYQAYHHPIMARTKRDGRPYLLRAVHAVFEFEGLKVERCAEADDQLLLNGRVKVEIVCVRHIDQDPSTAPKNYLLLNFGAALPDYFPPPPPEDVLFPAEESEDEEDFLEE